MSTPTPRTDAEEWTAGSGDAETVVWADFARTLERELAAERAIVSRIWVQLGSPTYEQLKGRSIYDLIDEMHAELATEREKAERYRLASLKLDAKLITERQKVRALTAILESICEEWGRNHDANPIGAGQRMETLASKALEKLEDEA